MAISASPPPTIAEYPSPALSPWDVVASQISALQAEDNARTFRFASPECKRTTGKMKRMSVRTFSVPHYFAPPTYRDMPTYEPVVGCGRFSVLAWVAHEEDEDLWRRRRCTFRIRVWPSGVASEGLVGDLRVPVASSPVEYHWRLTKQPAVRPACYEDDPMQAGISGGPPGKNCWMVDEVSRCWDGGDDGDGSRGGGPPPPGGRAAPLVVDPVPAPTAGSVLCVA